MRKRIMFRILILCILCSMTPLLIFYGVAANGEECGSDAVWSFDKTTGVLSISGTGDMSNYFLEGSPWYSLRENIKEIQICDGITSIGSWAFCGLDQVHTVSIPSSATGIGDYAFFECTSLESVALPQGITTIGDALFFGCSGLKALDIPESVRKISDFAFYGCTSLREITIPQQTTEIGECAFSGCATLTHVQIPATVNAVGNSAFNGCLSLKKISVDEKNLSYVSDSYGVMLNKEQTDIICIPGGLQGEYIIPATVTEIRDYAFCDAANLTAVSIPESVQSIGEYAFYGCISLQTVSIPDSVSRMGNYAFGYCTALEQVRLPEGMTSIPEGAFDSCTALKEIRIPTGVTSLGRYAFYSCSALENITIPEGVTNLDWAAFDSCTALKEISIPDSVETIGWATFQGCTGLTEVKLPERVKEIGHNAFADCTALTALVIANPDCVIYDSEGTLGNPATTTIYAPEGSTCSVYAQVYGYTIKTDDSEEENTSPTRELDVKIGHSLNLASDISINYAVAAQSLEAYTDVYLNCEVPIYEGNEQTGSTTVVIEPVLTGNYYYFTMNGLTAVRMGDVIESTLYGTKDGVEYQSAVDSYSISTYAYNQLNKEDAEEALKTLCANLLQYGGKAQLFKGYRTDALVDADMSETHRAYLADLDAVTMSGVNNTLEDVEAPAIAWVGKTLSLEAKVIVRFVVDGSAYEGDPAELSLRVSYTDAQGNLANAELKDPEVFNTEKQWYVFDFAQLGAAELRSLLSVAVFAGEEQLSQTLEYSVEAYCNNKTGSLGDLCKAMLAYSDSAKAFFA